MLNIKDRVILKKILDRGLLGTQLNYPTFNLADNLSIYILDNIKAIVKGSISNRDVLSLFAIASDAYGVPLRSEIRSFCDKHKNMNLSAEMLSIIFSEFIGDLKCYDDEYYMNTSEDGMIKKIYDIIPTYIHILENLPMYSSKEFSDYLNDNKKIIGGLDEGYEILYFLLSNHISKLQASDLFDDNLTEIDDNSEYEVLTNVDNNHLKDSFAGELLSGNIQLSTSRGYLDEEDRPQQDAVLSIVRSNDCFLNVVADGAGGSELGQRASLELVKGLKKWFLDLKNEDFEDLELLVLKLIKRIKTISDDIFVKYEKSYTTVVIALTVGEKTAIVNVGDSTAYSYDENNDDLHMLTILDSWAKGYYYEDIRWYSGNNIITAAIGDGYRVDPHVNIIDNTGQRIILSSDGVTDLVSDETFISYFKNSTSADKIIEDALLRPEISYEIEEEPGIVTVERLPKQADNISAIVINLPDSRVKCKKR